MAEARIFAVIMALYTLSGIAYFIPNAGLSAIIVHAIADIIAPPSVTYRHALLSSCVDLSVLLLMT